MLWGYKWSFEATNQALWLQKFILGLKIIDNINKILKIYCDSFAAIFLSKNDKYSKGTKYIGIKYLFVKEEVSK